MKEERQFQFHVFGIDKFNLPIIRPIYIGIYGLKQQQQRAMVIECIEVV